MKTWAPTWVFVSVVMLVGCGGVAYQVPQEESTKQSVPADQEAKGVPPAASRKLKKTVDITIQVDEPTDAAEKLKTLAKEYGGYVSNLTANRRDDFTYYSLTCRVAVDRLEEALQKIRDLAVRVEYESIRSEDVTEQYVNLEARLKTLSRTEAELLQLQAESRDRDHKTEDIMTIYEHLTTIRSQIEQIQGQLNVLDKLTSLSTINIELIPSAAAVPIVAEGWQPAGTVRQATRTLVLGLQNLADGAIWFGIVLLPQAIIVGLVVWLGVWLLWLVLRLLWKPKRNTTT